MSSLEEWELLDLLSSLVDKSLVVYEEQPDGTGRYRLLESVRQYALDRLGESGEAVQGRAASWFLAFAEEARLQLWGPEQASWFGRLEAEHDNLRASLAWCEQQGESGEENLREENLRLAGALWRFWWVRGHYSEGRQWLGRALARTTPEVAGPSGAAGLGPSAARAWALTGAGILAWAQGDYAEARVLAEEGLTISRELEDQQGIAFALDNLGNVALAQSDYATARALFEEGLTICRQLGDQLGIAYALDNLGTVASAQGDYAGARALHEQSLTTFRQLGDQQGIAMTLNNLGTVASAQGDYAGARALHEESLMIRRQLGAQSGIAESLDGMAGVAQGQSRPGRAARLGAAASALRESIGSPRSSMDQEEADKTMAAVREALGEEAFAAAWDTGRAMTWEQAAEYALSEGEPQG